MAYTNTTLGTNTTLEGTSLVDTFDSTNGNSLTVRSFQGDDTLTIDSSAVDGADIRMGGGEDTVGFSTTVANATVLLGGDDDTFTFTSSGSDVTVGGQQGDDTFTVSSTSIDDSRFAGGQGEDTFAVASVGDSVTIVGGSDDDTITVTSAGDDLFINGQVGEDTITVSTTGADAVIRGGSEDDTITLATNVDDAQVFGDKNDDTITDAAGANSLNGGDGADTITAGAGNDVINGDGGADSMTGEAGLDTLTGGAGADTFVYDNAGEAGTATGAFSLSAVAQGTQDIVAAAGFEYITDFDGSVDTIEVLGGSIVDATGLDLAGAAATSYFFTGTLQNATTFLVEAGGADVMVYAGAAIDGADISNSTADWVVLTGASSVTTASFTTA